jgi:hypothetical protein
MIDAVIDNRMIRLVGGILLREFQIGVLTGAGDINHSKIPQVILLLEAQAEIELYHMLLFPDTTVPKVHPCTKRHKRRCGVLPRSIWWSEELSHTARRRVKFIRGPLNRADGRGSSEAADQG